MRISLVRLAVAAWMAWLVTLGITAWLSFSGVLHANFLYMAVPLAVQLVCTVALVLGGIWRTLRGPRRFRAVAWVLLGVLPTLWMGAYVEYLFHFAAGRDHRRNLLVKAGTAITALLAEPYVRLYHPYPHEGRRFVMWSDSPEASEAVMNAMDAHILAMEEALGGRSEYKVYWVRGDVLGIGGRYGVGWLLGSRSPEPGQTEAYLDSLDRHEAAHFALDQLLPPHHEVPKLLHEGWAQLHTGGELSRAWRRCWIAQRQGRLLSLRELTSRDSYHDSKGPMYHQGCVLVDYLLRRFGHAKFLELCRTCHEATFDEDLWRVFGLGLDELDRAYQADLARYDSPDHWYFNSLPLADGVDRDRWRRFVDDYLAGVKRLRTPFRQSSVKMSRTNESVDEDGNHSTDQRHMKFHRDDRRRAALSESDSSGGLSIEIATPEVLFRLSGDPPAVPWRFRHCRVRGSLDFESALAAGELEQPYLEKALLGPLGDPAEIMITALGASPVDPRLVRVSFAVGYPWEDESQRMHGWWDVDPRHDYGLVQAERGSAQHPIAGPRFPIHKIRTTVEYQTIDGHTVPKTARLEWFGPKDTVRLCETDTIESCEFAAPADDVFEPCTYGDFGSPEPLRETGARRRAKLSSNVGVLTWIAGGSSLVGLLFGSVLLFGSLRQDRTTSSRDLPPAD